MADTFTFTIDGVEVRANKDQTILAAADEAGIYIPRLCNMDGLEPFGACRVCTVLVNGRPQSACTQPAQAGIVVENDTEELLDMRKQIIEMLFVEGNHFCMFCEKSGNCELQALAYRFGIAAPRFPFMFQVRDIDATHPEVFVDRNRCIMCARCIRASRDLDGKNVFQFTGRGLDKRISVNSTSRLADTDLKSADKAVDACPVGSILKKGLGFKVPIGDRLYDHKPIGSEIESRKE